MASVLIVSIDQVLEMNNSRVIFVIFRDFWASDLSTLTPGPLLKFEDISKRTVSELLNMIKFTRKNRLSLKLAFLSKGPYPAYSLPMMILHAILIWYSASEKKPSKNADLLLTLKCLRF